MSNQFSEFCKYGNKCKKLGDSQRKRTCMYAHTVDELQPILCRHSVRCRDIVNCFAFHPPLETKDEFIKKCCLVVPVSLVKVKKEKIKLCHLMKENFPCTNEKCTFAHSMSDIQPVLCTNGQDHDKDLCSYYHEGEEVCEYYKKFDPCYRLDSFVFLDSSVNKRVLTSEEEFMKQLREEEMVLSSASVMVINVNESEEEEEEEN